MTALPKLAIWKFSSCDGCQLSLLNCEDEFLPLLQRVRIARFLEATRAELRGPYDVSLVEGSVTTPDEVERITQIRDRSTLLIAIGACATSGGIQALRNLADVEEYTRAVYAHPEFIRTLRTSTPASAHVRIDLELQGCPISPTQLVALLLALLSGRRPSVPPGSVCGECKMRGITCLTVAAQIPCMGPVTQAGCNAICPSFRRGCFGCYGPMEAPNTASLAALWSGMGVSPETISRAFRTYAGNAPAFREESARHA
jgi:sulfhydrogenase subunit delta